MLHAVFSSYIITGHRYIHVSCRTLRIFVMAVQAVASNCCTVNSGVDTAAL